MEDPGNTGSGGVSATGGTVNAAASAICPDLLTIDKLGAADNLRGKVVRGFFQLMRLWPA